MHKIFSEYTKLSAMKLLSNYFQKSFTLLSISELLFFIRYLCGVSEMNDFKPTNNTEIEPMLEKYEPINPIERMFPKHFHSIQSNKTIMKTQNTTNKMFTNALSESCSYPEKKFSTVNELFAPNG